MTAASPSSTDALALVLPEAIAVFRSQKDLADRALAQVSDDNLHIALDADTNSIAVIMQHLSGNMLSRWRDFLTTDGEKPDRDRDGEFIEHRAPRAQLLANWERGWALLFATLDSLTIADLAKVTTIRGEPHTVVRSIHRQLSHYGYHVGQIVLIARHFAGANWTTLTVPRGKGESKAFNERIWKR